MPEFNDSGKKFRVFVVVGLTAVIVIAVVILFQSLSGAGTTLWPTTRDNDNSDLAQKIESDIQSIRSDGISDDEAAQRSKELSEIIWDYCAPWLDNAFEEAISHMEAAWAARDAMEQARQEEEALNGATNAANGTAENTNTTSENSNASGDNGNTNADSTDSYRPGF